MKYDKERCWNKQIIRSNGPTAAKNDYSWHSVKYLIVSHIFNLLYVRCVCLYMTPHWITACMSFAFHYYAGERYSLNNRNWQQSIWPPPFLVIDSFVRFLLAIKTSEEYNTFLINEMYCDKCKCQIIFVLCKLKI